MAVWVNTPQDLTSARPWAATPLLADLPMSSVERADSPAWAPAPLRAAFGSSVDERESAL